MSGNPLVRFDEGRVGRTVRCRPLSYSTGLCVRSAWRPLARVALPLLDRRRSHLKVKTILAKPPRYLAIYFFHPIAGLSIQAGERIKLDARPEVLPDKTNGPRDLPFGYRPV